MFLAPDTYRPEPSHGVRQLPEKKFDEKSAEEMCAVTLQYIKKLRKSTTNSKIFSQKFASFSAKIYENPLTDRV